MRGPAGYADTQTGDFPMKSIRIAAAVLSLSAFGFAADAQAGCLTGAVVGGLAGKLVGHGYAGAAAGCAYGVHRNRVKAQRNYDMQQGRSGYRTRY